jgi:hypothetical protein
VGAAIAPPLPTAPNVFETGPNGMKKVEQLRKKSSQQKKVATGTSPKLVVITILKILLVSTRVEIVIHRARQHAMVGV